jgi:excisionase family DNA binding protein
MNLSFSKKNPQGQDVTLFSKKQAAAEFGVCYRTIERWLASGYIKQIRIGGRVYVPYSEIYRIRDRFLEVRPDGRLLESQIRTVDDIHRRHEQLPYPNLSTRR